MGAVVEQDPNLTVFVAHDDELILSDVPKYVVARHGDFGFVRDETPAASENAVQLEGVEFGIAEYFG
ncbi:hypothetical protein [Rhodococcus jostii]|uniref:hypothetical protein n=1 Tax=Rhodococcus jostii TaxID=132919 RepID=UPI001F0809F4|nr:hypothetical protein [Rhodococcus jostii]